MLARGMRASLLALCAAGVAHAQASKPVLVPKIDGDWWRIASNPDLGALTGEHQEPVDFALWQARDGTWQLWSCIRKTNCGGKTRLFHRWEGKKLTDRDWKPLGVAMQADASLGETPGGLQAPHVLEDDGQYWMVYGDWKRICLATSKDGKTFTRWLGPRGQPDLFTGPYDNTRDPMLLDVGALYHCYYMGHERDATYRSAVFCRTSKDLLHWSKPTMVAAGGEAARYTNWFGGDAECPFVLEKDARFYLFRNLVYGKGNLNVQYASTDALNFGVGDDKCRIGWLPVAAPEIVLHEGQYFIAALEPTLDGIRLARLRWEEPAKEK